MTTQEEHKAAARAAEAELANTALCKLNDILNPNTADTVPVSVKGSTGAIELPRSVAQTLRSILANTAAGRAVTVVPSNADLTTQQAADMLNVSRPYLIKLLEQEKIAYRKVGTHRRIKADSLHQYERAMEIESTQAADELSRLTEDLGLYE